MSMSASNSSSFGGGCCCCCDVIAVAIGVEEEVDVIVCFFEELTLLVTLIGIFTLDDVSSRLLLPLLAATTAAAGRGCFDAAVDDTVVLAAMADEDELINVPPPFVVVVVVVEDIDVGDNRLDAWGLSVFLNCCDIIRSKSVAGLSLRVVASPSGDTGFVDDVVDICGCCLTLVDVEGEERPPSSSPFVIGRMSSFDEEGEVTVVIDDDLLFPTNFLNISTSFCNDTNSLCRF
jgi:hypothetical protein